MGGAAFQCARCRWRPWEPWRKSPHNVSQRILPPGASPACTNSSAGFFLSTKRVNPVPDTEPYTLLLLLLHQISTTSTPSSSLVAKQTNKNLKHISSSHLCFPMRRTPLPSSLHLFISSPSSSTLHLTISRGTAALCTIVMATTLGRQDGGVVAGLASFTVLNVRTARCCLLKI